MEKKLKYLLGLLVFGFGLLFSSQSFAESIYVDGVSYGGPDNSTSYSYIFSNVASVSMPVAGYLGVSLVQNGSTVWSYTSNRYEGSVCTQSAKDIQYNSSLFEYVPYSGVCYTDLTNVSHQWYNMYGNYSLNTSSRQYIQVLLGRNTDFGNNIITLNTYTDGYVPKYSIGGDWFGANDSLIVSSSFSPYYRIFFDGFNRDQLLGFTPYNGYGSNMGTGSYGWEYFYTRGTRTNYGYIVDDGQNYPKHSHFGLFEYGYSYTYRRAGQDTNTVNRQSLGFRTVFDDVKVYLKIYGDLSYSELQNYSIDGILTLRANTYPSAGQDNGIFFLSKDPYHYSRVLYEHWSCNLSNINTVFAGGNSLANCVKLDGGYLSYNGSLDVLPFTSISDSYNYNSSTALTNSGYSPLLYDLFGYGIHGRSYYIGDLRLNGHDYQLVSDGSVSIRESYLKPALGGSTINSGVLNGCWNDPVFYSSHKFFCDGLQDTVGQAQQIPGLYDTYIQYGIDASGNVITWVTNQEDLIAQTSGYTWIQSGDNKWYLIPPDPIPLDNTGVNSSGSIYNSLGNWFTNYFESGFFFKCPFPYDRGSYKEFTIRGTKIFYETIGRDFLAPIYCMGGGYRFGKNMNLFGINSSLLSGQILSSPDYQGLYNLFDIILSIGILFLVFRIYNLIK